MGLLRKKLVKIFFLIVLIALVERVDAADFHHVHIRAHDTLEAATWYAENMSGEQLQVANFHGVRFNRKLMLFAPKERLGPGGSEAPPDLKTSSGTSLDYLGFSFKELQAKLISLQLAGAKVVRPVEPINSDAGRSIAFVEDPWGQKVAVLSDPEIEGLHHACIVSTRPESTLAWFSESFGGTIRNFNGEDGLRSIRYGDFWIVVSKIDKEPEPNMFSMIDHLGFHVPDVEKKMLALEDVIVLKPTQGFYWWQAIPGMPGPKNGFVENSAKVLIEVMQLR